MNVIQKSIEKNLWVAAEQLRANGSLKLNEIGEPISGLIFLKFADVKFKKMAEVIQNEFESLTDEAHKLEKTIVSNFKKLLE